MAMFEPVYCKGVDKNDTKDKEKRIDSTEISESKAKTSNSTRTTGKNENDALKDEENATKLQEKVKQQENLVRGELGKKFNKIQEEAKKLSQIQGALESLEREQQKDIAILRNRIEKIERDVSANRIVFQRKEKEYLDAKGRLEESEKEKNMLTSHLRLIIFENEKKKEEKLNQLMEKLGMVERKSPEQNKGFRGFATKPK